MNLLPSSDNLTDADVFNSQPETDPFTETEPTEEDRFADFPLQTRYQSGFCICDESTANWYLRKINNIDNEKARVLAQCNEIIAALDKDRDNLTGKFQADFEQWAINEIAARGKGKKLALLQGTIVTKTVPASFSTEDKEAAMKHAPDLATSETVIMRKFDATAYNKRAKQAMEANGELLPGVLMKPAYEKVDIAHVGTDGKGGAK